MGALEHVISQTITTWYLSAGYLGIVLAMAIESCCVPLPSELVMPIAGFFVVQHPDRCSLVGVALAGVIGCLAGSIVAYGIGRAGGRPLLLRYGRYVLISQADSDRADRLFARYGATVAFFSRLLPVVRTYVSLPAGIARMSFWRFCVYTLLGSLPWCLALAWVGTKVGEQSQQLSTLFHSLDALIGAALVVAVGLYVWRHVQHDRVARALPATHAPAPEAQAPRPAAHKRPRPSPTSVLTTDERPTMPVIESATAWTNRFARPHVASFEAPSPRRTAPRPPR